MERGLALPRFNRPMWRCELRDTARFRQLNHSRGSDSQREQCDDRNTVIENAGERVNLDARFPAAIRENLLRIF